jgi:Family of unknown function (DUF6492)
MPISPDWAFITPSYSGDFERCQMLCQSMDMFLSGKWHHYIIVDKPDFQRFKPLGGPRRTIMQTHEVAPPSMHHLFNIPFSRGRSLWWARKTGFFIGWHMQQIIKMGIASILSEEGLAYCDSDVFFVKPFDTADLTRANQFRLFRSPQRYSLAKTTNPKYTKPGLEILALPLNEIDQHFTYIDNFVTWHRPTVLALRTHIETASGKDWYTELGARLDVSEYTLYGLFVDEIQKTNPHIFATSDHLCKTQWMRQSKTEAEIERFCGELEPQQVTIGVQSFAGVDLSFLKKQLAKAISQYKPS